MKKEGGWEGSSEEEGKEQRKKEENKEKEHNLMQKALGFNSHNHKTHKEI